MLRSTNLIKAREEGRWAASLELERLGLDTWKRIDVFKVIRRQRLWFFLDALDGPLGAYRRGSPEGGMIIVNAQRPRGVQRLTAAHEYGHHVLGHEGSSDDMEDIDAPEKSTLAHEAAAQAFATDFLMPSDLTHRLWRELVTTRHEGFETTDVYRLSLEIGASFKATVNQLRRHRIISDQMTHQLLKTSPAAIKKKIGFGKAPQNAWADSWPLALADSGRTLHVQVDDELHITLPEIPSTGYRWELDSPEVINSVRPPTMSIQHGKREPVAGSGSIELIGDRYQRQGVEGLFEMGHGGERHLAFRILAPGRRRMCLRNQRGWEAKADSDPVYDLDLVIEPNWRGMEWKESVEVGASTVGRKLPRQDDEEQLEMGKRLREGRELKGLSRKDVADCLNVSIIDVNAMESGKREIDSLELGKLARFYELDYAYFLGPVLEAA